MRVSVSVLLAVLWLALGALSLAAGPLAQTSMSDGFWQRFQPYEHHAMHDYRWRSISEDMLRRSDELWMLHASLRGQAGLEPCKDAARTLSMMVRATYFSSLQGAIPDDWFLLAPVYMRERSDCLKALKIDEREHSLPIWFGR